MLCASSIGYIESSVGEHLTYSTSMGIAMLVVIGCLWLIIKFGPEEHGKFFVMPTPEPATLRGHGDTAEAYRIGLATVYFGA